MKLSAGKIILGVFGLALLWAIVSDPPGTNATSSAAKPAAKAQEAPKYDKSEGAQSKREALLKEAGKGGLVAKVDCRTNGSDVWVNRMFDDVSIDVKRGLVAVVHEWCFNGPDDGFVRIRSNQTDKELGRYTPTLGLDLE